MKWQCSIYSGIWSRRSTSECPIPDYNTGAFSVSHFLIVNESLEMKNKVKWKWHNWENDKSLTNSTKCTIASYTLTLTLLLEKATETYSRIWTDFTASTDKPQTSNLKCAYTVKLLHLITCIRNTKPHSFHSHFTQNYWIQNIKSVFWSTVFEREFFFLYYMFYIAHHRLVTLYLTTFFIGKQWHLKTVVNSQNSEV